jgi:hypothetical protein
MASLNVKQHRSKLQARLEKSCSPRTSDKFTSVLPPYECQVSDEEQGQKFNQNWYSLANVQKKKNNGSRLKIFHKGAPNWRMARKNFTSYIHSKVANLHFHGHTSCHASRSLVPPRTHETSIHFSSVQHILGPIPRHAGRFFRLPAA